MADFAFRKSNPERLKHAALKIGKKTYLGTTHGDAYEAYQEAIEKGIHRGDHNMASGYVTSKGRFVEGKEAIDIADRAKQLPHGYKDLPESHPMRKHVYAEDLDLD